MRGNSHAGFGKGLTEKDLWVPRRLPTSLDEGRPGEAVLNWAAHSTRARHMGVHPSTLYRYLADDERAERALKTLGERTNGGAVKTWST